MSVISKPERFFDLKFITTLSITSKRLFTRRYKVVKGFDALAEKRIKRSELSDIYVASSDFILWGCFIYRLSTNREPTGYPEETADFITKHSNIAVKPEDIKNILDAPSTLIAKLVAEVLASPILSAQKLDDYWECWTCCYEKKPPCEGKYGDVNPNDCFDKCMDETTSR